ncbi:MAG TPA: serine hydrolase domain-containing protein [Thermoanaerobaculia bacterium]|nr:serine hydrolase domain-containing protein [Thermoanaerobaculia bacterium]
MAIRAFVLLLLCPTLFGAHLAIALPGAVDVSTPVVAPASVGMSEPVLRAGVTLFEDAVARHEIKGAVLLVARRGEVVLHQAVGWRNQEEGLPMERDTLFRMASNTKPLIATAILMLAEEGELGLNDNVRRYMPSWDNHRSAFVKVRHLLTHTSGLRIPTLFLQPLMAPSAEHPDAPTLKLEAARFGEVGPEFQPGVSYSYNNPGYNTLGALIEIASGQRLDEFLRARIYGPLGMVDSYNHEPNAPQERMARVYRRRNGSWSVGWTPGDPPDLPFPRASGGMVSTAGDYFRFLQLWLDGGELDGFRLLSEESVAAATRNQSGLAGEGYGYGWATGDDGSFGHGGSDGTWVWVDPEREIVGIVFTQSPGGEIPSAQFRRVVEASVADF